MAAERNKSHKRRGSVCFIAFAPEERKCGGGVNGKVGRLGGDAGGVAGKMRLRRRRTMCLYCSDHAGSRTMEGREVSGGFGMCWCCDEENVDEKKASGPRKPSSALTFLSKQHRL